MKEVHFSEHDLDPRGRINSHIRPLLDFKCSGYVEPIYLILKLGQKASFREDDLESRATDCAGFCQWAIELD
jgi:hypothetical protein